MRIVVDSNIVFSAILNTNSKISKIILKPKSRINFYSTTLLQDELFKHRNKLKQISGYTEEELSKITSLIITKIRFINIELIPIKVLIKAESFTHDIDIDDTEFVALTEHIRGKLWTGDKALINGLRNKNWHKVLTTDELLKSIKKSNQL